jgi:hypothetical protein
MKHRKTFHFFPFFLRPKFVLGVGLGLTFVLLLALEVFSIAAKPTAGEARHDDIISSNAQQMLADGRQTFRFDTFGDEVFWGDTLRLHEAVAQLSPRQALALGLKVDLDALPPHLVEKIKRGEVDLDDRRRQFSFSNSMPSSG